ncbi:MAG: DMT family transporter [Desulfamplus sp.]|nr:DMT family transporter [Desulfamplus sp.]
MKTLEAAGLNKTANLTNNELSLQASLYTTFLCILFGGNVVAIKISLSGLGTFTNAGIRFALASIALLIWAKMTKQTLYCKRKQGYKLLILSLIFTVQLSCFYCGLSKTSASHGTLIANLLPFIVLILAHFFIPGDQMNIKKVAGITFGFSGVLFLFFDNHEVSGSMQRGDLIVACAVFLWGCSAVYTKRIISEISVMQITLYPMMFGAPLFLIAGFLWDGEMVRLLDGSIIQSLVYQSFVTASYGFIAWNRLLLKFGATAVHSFIFIMPVSGLFFSVLLLNEPLTLNIAISIVLIVAGMIVVNRNGFKNVRIRPLP